MSTSWTVWTNKSSRVSPATVFAGHDKDGSQIHVARAHHFGELIPGKFIPRYNTMYISFGGKEIVKDQFEVFNAPNAQWVRSAYGHVPQGAVLGGHTRFGERLYVGRVFYKGTLTPGKVHPSHKCLYIPFGHVEVKFEEDYEILVA